MSSRRVCHCLGLTFLYGLWTPGTSQPRQVVSFKSTSVGWRVFFSGNQTVINNVLQKRSLLWSSLLAHQVKDLALSLLWHGFDPWPGNFHMLWVQHPSPPPKNPSPPGSPLSICLCLCLCLCLSLSLTHTHTHTHARTHARTL